MISILLIIFSTLSWSIPLPGDWASAFKIIERHEFYPTDQIIASPKDSWQHLFSILILNERFQEQKDCVFYFVSGEAKGKLKLKTIGTKESCLDHLLEEGDLTWTEVKGLQFSNLHSGLKLSFTQDKKSVIWEIVTADFVAPTPTLHLSSVEMKSPKYVLLAPATGPEEKDLPVLKNDELCFGVNDVCEETQSSTCHLCPEGWYEIPNGCAAGPKYCGRLNCGGKNAPACRRGMSYQKNEGKFDCRTDSSFAYCQKGLMVQCEGQKAYCR
jgi:hypothetical protein